MYDSSFCPKLRLIEIIPFEYQGRKSILLRDPLGYTDGIFMLPASLAPILSMMDGSHTLRDIQVVASLSFGRLVMFEEIVGLVASLDENFMLETQRFEELRKRLEKEFLASPIRPPSHSDKAYPADPKKLRVFLQKILDQARNSSLSQSIPRVIIAPHIDLTSGSKVFAAAYQRASFPKGSRIIVLGTGHFLESILSVLAKDFETPLGLARVDREFIEALEKIAGPEIRGHEWGHRIEHSIEFQLVFLQYLLGNNFSLVPILCSGLEAISSEDQVLLERFIRAMRELVDEDTYFVAGVDFCHLGIRYGDLVPASEKEKEIAISYDRRLLDCIMALDIKGFYDLIMKIENRYRVCGFGPLYVLLRILEGRKLIGEILYQEAVDFGAGSMVSLAAAALYDQNH